MAEAKKTTKEAKAPAKKAESKEPVAKKELKEKSAAFAVVRTGGKQYVVREGDRLTIEKLSGEHKAGGKVVFDEVLLASDGTSTKVGTPLIAGAKVEAEFVENGKTKKILVVRFKEKSNRRKVKGHRQPYSKVTIKSL